MKKENGYFSTAVIDADYILWIACNKSKIYNENSEALKDEKGNFVYKDKTIEEVTDTCDSYINDLLHVCGADSYIFCLTAPGNFRYKVDENYKANRKGAEKPMWFKEAKNHLIEKWGAIECKGLEADDMVNIIVNSLENSFIVAVDKDLITCLPGRHFDARKGQAQFVTVTESQANFAFSRSLLTGDSIDGVPNIKRGYGPKTAEKELLASTDTSLEDTVLSIYTREFGEEGKIKFDKQKKLLKILSSLEEVPEGVTFAIPEPYCYDCVETTFSQEQYRLELLKY